MKNTSIGTWAYNVGPYGESPIPFDTVGKTLSELKFDGLELGGFNGYPNPGNHPEKEHRDGLKEKMTNWGLSFSGFAQDLWSEQLLNTDDQSKYISSFKSNVNFAVDLGIKGVRVDCVQPPTIHAEADFDTLFNKLTKTWDTCINYAADKGIYVTW